MTLVHHDTIGCTPKAIFLFNEEKKYILTFTVLFQGVVSHREGYSLN